MSIIPPSLTFFNTSKENQLLAQLARSLENNPVSSDLCKIHQFETAYNLMSFAPSSFAQSAETCDKRFFRGKNLFQEAIKGANNYCIKSTSQAAKSNLGALLVSVVFIVFSFHIVFGIISVVEYSDK